jgi:hypothetical protein
LATDPFNVPEGADISIKVTALNYYGESDMSVASITGSMILVPYPPIDLLNDATVTSAS